MKSLQQVLNSQGAYKSYEAEEKLDIYFYRPIGALIAHTAHRLLLSPNHLTLANMGCGILGAILIYPDSTLYAGLALILLSTLFDASDGQLARLTHTQSQTGRILDGVADYVVFAGVYLALSFRWLSKNPDAYPISIFALMVLAGASHSCQSSLYDYYRVQYMDYVEKHKVPMQEATLEKTREAMKAAEREGKWWTRFFWWGEMNYTTRQRKLAKSHAVLEAEILRLYPNGDLPEQVVQLYRKFNLPMIRFWNLFGSNLHFMLIFAALLANRISLYFWTEILLLNLLLILAIQIQSHRDRTFSESLALL